MEVVGGVHALVHPPLVPGQSALDRLALRGRQHHKLLQVIELDLRGRSALLEGERSTVIIIIIIIIIRSSSLIGCQSLSHGTELSPGGRACHYHCDNHHHHRHHHRKVVKVMDLEIVPGSITHNVIVPLLVLIKSIWTVS